MNKQTVINEDNVNAVIDVILRKVAKDPEFAEEDDEPGRWYFYSFALSVDDAEFSDDNYYTLKDAIYSIGDHDPDPAMRDLCNKDQWHAPLVHDHDEDGHETNRVYVMLDIIYAVEQVKTDRNQFVKNLVKLINKMLESVPGLYLTDNYYTNGGNENENQTNV